MRKNSVMTLAAAILLGGFPGPATGAIERPVRVGNRAIHLTTATRRQIDPDPSLSRQQRRYAERLAAKRAKYSDVTRLTYRIPLPA